MTPVERLESRLPGLYKEASCDHNLGHVLRIVRNAKIVGRKEGADLSVLIPAAMLHDIALKKGFIREKNEKHAVLGAAMAKPILKACGFPEEQIRKICSAILQHSTDNPTNEPETREGNCLFDSDKLDAINPCGVARYMQEQALEHNTNAVKAAEDFIPWLRTVKFRTKTGRKMGKDRARAIEFCQEIIRSGRISSPRSVSCCNRPCFRCPARSPRSGSRTSSPRTAGALVSRGQ